ncbi:IPT/TIG domain-containing protein [Rhodocytophaga aerolata]|uniref:IPT/TIG domain-containing protein n=1 Tax=Rhodocytophaga aerolata TaxID=455078 RepID=A0ABT8RKG6_9BACT|nr:IPT/TIG domain-containing protein [Rhodocytophaga aerolata]MDO1451888.1 IPT/TIG domain-containing protein [Rhodocytophaga aerolata]
MKLYLHRVYVLSIILLFFNLSACKKDNPDPVVLPPKVDPTVPESVALTITAINPISGTSGTAVTITGTGFSTVLTENVVTINAKNCLVTAATATSINIIVPPVAGSGDIVVTTNSKSAKSTSSFRYVETITVTTVAGSVEGYIDGTSTNAKFQNPHYLAVGSDGTLYISDTFNNRIRKISPDGIVSTVAGNGDRGIQQYVDGPAAQARFNSPNGIAVANDGTLYVAESGSNRIRKISPDGIVSTIAGDGNIMGGYADGPGTQALFKQPTDISIASDGTLYITDLNNYRIRKISPDGIVSTVAGNGSLGAVDGPAAQATFDNPSGITIGSDGTLYITERHKIRKISPDGIVSTVAGNADFGTIDGTRAEARFYFPADITVAGDGTLYVSEFTNNKIRKIDSAGVVTTLAGDLESGYVDGTATEARFFAPRGMALVDTSILYVVDDRNHKIRKVTIQ